MHVTEETKQAKTGRPSKYDESLNEQVYRFCLLGMTNEELAEALGICTATLADWKNKYPLFSDAIMRGKEIADAEVSESLFKRAKGYSHDDVHISNFQGNITETPLVKHYPPDTAAGIFWLKNRRRKTGITWSDKVETELSGPGGTPLSGTLDIDAIKSLAFALRQLAGTQEST